MNDQLMKLIASNIFDFTSWYKFGQKHIHKSTLLDLDVLMLQDDQILNKIGYFEEDDELFFLQIPEDSFESDQDIIQLDFSAIVAIIPLSQRGRKSLEGKIPDFIISDEINIQFAKKIIDQRNRHVSIDGGKRILSVFGIPEFTGILEFQTQFMISLQKYFTDLNSEQDTLLDNIIFYERSKPYPVSDIGYLFDLGNIARTRYNLSDSDFRNKDEIISIDPDKYDLITEVLALSNFLQNKEGVGIWTDFIEETKKAPLLAKLNLELVIFPFTDSANNLLIIGFYLKFRDLIRRTSDLTAPSFLIEVNRFIQKVPLESSIALFMAGMFFGSLRFKELYYRQVPMLTSNFRSKIYVPEIKAGKVKEPAKNKPKASVKTLQTGNKIETPVKRASKKNVKELKEPIQTTSPIGFEKEFLNSLTKCISTLGKEQQKHVVAAFKAALKFDKNDTFTSQPEYMVNILEAKSKSVNGKKGNVSLETVNLVKVFLREMFPDNFKLK